MIQAKKYMLQPLPLSVSLRSIIMITSLDHSVSYLLFNHPPPPPVPILPFCCSCCLVFCCCFVCLLCFFLLFWPLVWFVASDSSTTICHLGIVNVCVIIILSISYHFIYTQISILLLCFLYSLVELMITMYV